MKKLSKNEAELKKSVAYNKFWMSMESIPVTYCGKSYRFGVIKGFIYFWHENVSFDEVIASLPFSSFQKRLVDYVFVHIQRGCSQVLLGQLSLYVCWFYKTGYWVQVVL